MDSPQDAITVIDRRTGQPFQEKVLGDRLLRLAYSLPLRPVCRLLLYRYALVSRLMGWYCDSGLSRRKIASTIAELDLDMSDVRDPVDSFGSFNAFFTRHLRENARSCDAHPEVFSSPADARLSAFPELDGTTCLPVKGRAFAVGDLLGDPVLGDCFYGGTALVFRLCPADYHRYHYPAAGHVLRDWDIPGKYDSVNPVSLRLGLPVFVENRRHAALLELDMFGDCAYIEVGAFGVGGIVQTHLDAAFGKLDEKGYFKFGGSTLILLVRAGAVRLAEDLVANSRRGLETLVRVGDTIGTLGEKTQ